ncbi:MAG: DUF3788 domain-containing protein [Verrucomicrobia bacterium]|nr:DUF3788 domain-containing protein [Verrucomicrobiota bacterium]
MSANAFINKPKQPTDSELAAALDPAKAVWDQFLSELSQDHGVNGHEWKCHSPKWGWSLRVKRKERTVVWLAPCENCFTVLFILGEKAMRAARQTKFPQRVAKAMDEAVKWPEGTGVRLQVRSSRDVAALMKLAAIKLAN